MSKLLGACALGLLLACTQNGSTDPGGEPLMDRPHVDAPRVPPALAATTRAALMPEGSRALSEIHHVHLDVELVGADVGRQASIEFVTPRGDVFERRTQALSGTAWDTQRLGFDLLVAGTMIDTAELSGTWQARVFVDGAPLAAQSFELAP